LPKGHDIHGGLVDVGIAHGIDELHTLTAQRVSHMGVDIIGHQQPIVGHLLDLINQGAEVRVLCPLLYLDCECFAARVESHDCIDLMVGYPHIPILGMQAQLRRLRDSLLKNFSFSAFFLGHFVQNTVIIINNELKSIVSESPLFTSMEGYVHKYSVNINNVHRQKRPVLPGMCPSITCAWQIDSKVAAGIRQSLQKCQLRKFLDVIWNLVLAPPENSAMESPPRELQETLETAIIADKRIEIR
jgi:hypothetical protein